MFRPVVTDHDDEAGLTIFQHTRVNTHHTIDFHQFRSVVVEYIINGSDRLLLA